jgi:leucyl aminopeptidase (aminopeptidase T)
MLFPAEFYRTSSVTRTHCGHAVMFRKPLSYGSTLIENFTVTFERGSIVKMSAEKNAVAGEAGLRTGHSVNPAPS